MNCNLSKTAEKVRNSTTREGAPKFTGAVRYKVIGSIEGFDPASPDAPAKRIPVRHALGTEDKQMAQRLVEKIDSAYISGPDSPLWPELKGALPYFTFKFFADRIRYQDTEALAPVRATAKPIWADLRDSWKIEMDAMVQRYYRREAKNRIAPRTQKSYLISLKRFETFLQNDEIKLDDITPALIEKYKIDRHSRLQTNGGSVATDIAFLSRIFSWACKKGLMERKPIDSSQETKPGKNPKAPARPLTADELSKLREYAGEDLLAFVVLRWTGLRGGDAVNLTWKDVRFDQGQNGEIEIMTQKRLKKAVIPLAPELRDALEARYNECQKATIPHGASDFVLYNPKTEKPYSKGDPRINDAGRKKLYERIKTMGQRVKPEPVDVTPHDFRHTFACDMIARGEDTYCVAQMLADSIETIAGTYAEFVQAARDAVQHKMAHGIGIEERAKLNREKRQKVVSFPASA